jgi:hypothetical protein
MQFNSDDHEKVLNPQQNEKFKCFFLPAYLHIQGQQHLLAHPPAK